MSKNEITGDTLVSKTTNEKFSSGYDLIQWGNEESTETVEDLKNKIESGEIVAS